MNPKRSIQVVVALFAVGLLGMGKPAETFFTSSSGVHRYQRPNSWQVVAHEKGEKPALLGYGSLPLRFEANLGQTNDKVKFLARGQGYTVFLTAGEAVFALSSRQDRKVAVPVLRLKLFGANPASRVSGVERLPGKSNYIIGNDPRKWRTNVPAYAKVRYEDVYPGVDLVYYGKNGQLEYDLLIAPGANVKAIRLGFEGADMLTLDSKGNLIVGMNGAEILQRLPIIYQKQNGTKVSVPGRYVLLGDRQVGFDVSAYDPSRGLVIDPVLDYSTYLGGSGGDAGRALAVDFAGSAYVAGSTVSADFPTTEDAFQPRARYPSEAFITKLNPEGSALVYSTYLGGGDHDQADGIAIDGQGHAYVVGLTFSQDFPTKNAFQRGKGGGFCDIGYGDLCPDAFVTKLKPDGSALVYSTYLGGSGVDGGEGIASDVDGNTYVAGWTSATNFPTVKPLQGVKAGDYDAFVAKFDRRGSALYSTYLGGSDEDYAVGVAADKTGGAYVSGVTESLDFPTAKSFQPNPAGSRDAFIAKLNPRGSALRYSTYLGGSQWDGSYHIAVDGSGSAYVAGVTGSPDFPTLNPFQQYGGNGDAFVTKFAPSGTALRYSTFLGGSSGDRAVGISVDAIGKAYVTGATQSTDFPLLEPVQPNLRGIVDAFATVFRPQGSRLVYSTYLGGTEDDLDELGEAIAVDGTGNAYLAGWTDAIDFPTVRPFQRFNRGSQDAFLSKIAP